MRICPNCGEENPDRFRLCGFCGTSLVATVAPEDVRKVVTVVFSDLQGSTRLGERLDSETLREVMSRYFDTMRDALESHGGTIEKFIGDAVMAVFGLPTLHEDDALRAVRAAAAMQRGLAELNDGLDRTWGLRLTNRTGVNTGEVVAGDPAAGQRLVTGDAVNLAARLEQTAQAGEVLLGELTHRLVRDEVEAEPLPPLTLKGKSKPVLAFRLVSVRERRHAPAPRTTPLVGRTAELRELENAFAAARDGGCARLVTLIGQAGVGKSRLAEELAAQVVGRARVLRCRCLSYGRGITFWPLAELVRAAAGIEESDPADLARDRLYDLIGADADDVRRRVAAAVGLSVEEFPVAELFWGARKLLELLAAELPLIVILEDLHWAELTFLDLVEHITESAEQAMMLVGTAREDVFELRPEWSAGIHASRLELGELSTTDTAAVVENLAGQAAIPAAARARIAEAAGGNALFAEQLLTMLIDEGRLDGADGGRLEELPMPPTIHALLAARLDRLSLDQRGVLEPASVVGLEFEVAAVHALAADPLKPEVAGTLPRLAGKLLVEPLPAAVDPSYRFHHALIRDAAYHRLLKRARADLHERFVTWAKARYHARGDGEELEEILGYHLEQAHRYLHDLAPLDDRGRALGAEAARRLAAAGSRAFAREDMPAAANLLRRAVGLMDRSERERRTLLLPLGEAFTDIGEFALAEVYLEEAIELANDAADEPTAVTAALLRYLARGHGGGRADWGGHIVRTAEVVVPALEEADDHGNAATAWRAVAWAHGTSGRYALTAEAAEQAMDHATAAGDERQRRRAAVQYAVAALYGPTAAPDAIERCELILAQAAGDRRTQGLVTSLLARLVGMRGDIDRARDLYRSAQRTLRDTGRSVVGASTSLDTCGVEMLAGDPARAERELMRDYEALSDMGEKYLLSTVAGELVRALAAQGREAEAERFSAVAEELAEEDDVASQALWRAGRARILLANGRPEAAVLLVREAVRLLEGGDAVVTKADLLSDEAEILARAGDAAAARGAASAALELHDHKGNVAAAAAVRRLLDCLSAQRM